ncbi:MAG: SRPBCC family protein [Pyrinomonadaceae bacterium]
MSLNSEFLPANNLENSGSNTSINIGGLERIACAVAGGALAFYGLRRRSIGGLALSVAGAALLHRGSTGHCNAYDALGINTSSQTENEVPVARDVHVEKSITINKSPEELYNFWREFENLPRFMNNLESVTSLGFNRWHWVAKGPAGSKIEWDAEIYNEKPNEMIAWRSLEGSDVTNAGSVHFEPATGERGTQVKVVLNYNAPAGKISALFAKLFGQEPGQMIEEDLRRLKQVLETGEIATVEGQPSGRDPQARPLSEVKTSSETPLGEREKSRAASSMN